MVNEIKTGQFPVRYVEALGREHGYMLFGYYAPLPFYVGTIFHLIGINLVGALKRSFLLAILTGAAGVFSLSYQFFGALGAVVSAVVYVFSPFLGYDVFWRGGLGEVWAMGFMPWVLLFSYRAIRNAHWREVGAGAVALCGLLLSHNLTAYMGAGFLMVWTLSWLVHYKKGIVAVLFLGIGGFGLSAFFWVPAFVTRSLVWVSYLQADRRQIFESLLRGNPQEILFPTFIPMVTNWTAIVIPLVAWWIVRRRIDIADTRKAVSVMGMLFLVSLFLVSGLSRPVWDMLFPVFYIFQYPWRFLTMMTVLGATISGGMVLMSKKKQLLSVLLLSVIIVWVNFANFRPFTYEFIDKYVPRDPCGTSWDFEYLPISVHTCLKVPWEKPYRIVSGDMQVSSFTSKPRTLSLNALVSRESVMQLAYYSYPGWRSRIDGKDVPIFDANDHGLIEFVVSPGEHIIQATLEESPIERWSTKISLVTALALFLLLVWGLVKLAGKRTVVHKKV
ncbi:hypothetical protein KJZ67_02460 [Patescibacteria group bacterium]|nr:hypothetical protein [Patescibacteria group bacterium]